MATDLLSHDEDDVLAWLGAGEVAKARPYVDLVRQLEVEGHRIRASVPGTAREPYLTVASLADGELYSACSCPVGGHCKHVAAILLRAIADRTTSQAVRPGVLSWVEDLRRTSIAVAKKKARPASARQQLYYILKSTPDKRHFGVELRKGKHPETAEEWWKVDRALMTPPQFVAEEDLGILRLLWAARGNDHGLRAFARTLAGDPASADDLAQDAMMKAWDARSSFQMGTNMKAWTFMILRNQFYSEKRRSWRQSQLDQEAAERTLVAVDDPEAPVALDELRLSLAQLPAEQREALILVGAGGFAYEEAAEICGCAVGTVKSRVSRARKALHSILEDGSYERDGSAAGDAMSAILADAERLSTAR